MPVVMINNKKCTGCRMCEQACSLFHEAVEGANLPRLAIAVDEATGVVKGMGCLQTACGQCADICPEKAIEVHSIEVAVPGVSQPMRGFVLLVNEEKCTNCGACYEECPTGMIKEHPVRHVAYKCDLCGGTPQCAVACQDPNPKAVAVRPGGRDLGDD
jgi:anaerobic carbon-monoxide dehydrogenase iron sulfur subunit